jgi:D-alanyl-D-alanine carboxypeptidase
MTQPAASRPTRRTVGPTAVNLAIVTAAIIAALVYQSASSSASSFGESPPALGLRSLPQPAPSLAPAINDVPRGAGGEASGGRRVVSEADGALPDGVTVFDDAYSGVANLQPDLLDALREAATDAREAGIAIHLNSGWRSRAYQEQLHREAVSRYGSEQEAARWVATAETSAHVSGDAVDLGPFEATSWLSRHGARYGLCQVYRNEPWHYELRPTAGERGCPPMLADSAHGPDLPR